MNIISIIVASLMAFGSIFSPNFGATILTTDLSDTINIFRTNVNTSLANLNAAISPAGSDTEIQYNNRGAFGGDSKLTWSSSTQAFIIGGTATSTIYGDGTDSVIGGGLTIQGDSNLKLTGGVNAHLFLSGGGDILGVGGTIRMFNASNIGVFRAQGDVNNPGYTFTNDMDTGMWLPSASNLSFDVSSTERFLLTDTTAKFSVDVGIGTSTPATALHVIDTASTTVTIGSPTLSGCITMGDTDDGGVTYLTVLNGVLSATTTKPSICQ